MRRFLLRAFGAFMGLVAVGPVHADETNGLSPGARVRLTAPSVSGKRLVGTLRNLDDVTLTFLPRGAAETMQVPRSAITGLEVGRGSRRRKGAIIGAVAGLVSGVALGLATGHDCSEPEFPDVFIGLVGGCRGTGRAAVISLAAVPAGALLGFALAPGEKWETVTPGRLRIAVRTVHGGGLRAAVSVHF
jgi:hypothetical protein